MKETVWRTPMQIKWMGVGNGFRYFHRTVRGEKSIVAAFSFCGFSCGSEKMRYGQ